MFRNQAEPRGDFDYKHAGVGHYEYDHAKGRHVLVNGSNPDVPKYSWRCICCNLIDVLIFAGCIAFLYFAVRFALYCLENSGDSNN
jgi:hypothetical protein